MNAEKQYSLTRNVHIQYSHSRVWRVHARISIPLVCMPAASQILYTIISYLYRINLLLKLCAITIRLPIVGSHRQHKTEPTFRLHPAPLSTHSRSSGARNELQMRTTTFAIVGNTLKPAPLQLGYAQFTEAVMVRWTISLILLLKLM